MNKEKNPLLSAKTSINTYSTFGNTNGDNQGIGKNKSRFEFNGNNFQKSTEKSMDDEKSGMLLRQSS